MLARLSQCLLALQHHSSLDAAAQACGLSPQEFHGVLYHAERTYGRPMVGKVDTRRLTPGDEAVERLAVLLDRRSVSPKRLGPPGPSRSDLELILQVALRAPDHGSLRPWRVIEFGSETRDALAEVFEEEKRRRDPLASSADLQQAREHATRAPTLLGFVVSPKPNSKVPSREQWLAAGAALCNLLQAAHQLGFGAIMLSGERCHDSTLLSQLGVLSEEVLAGFVSIGRIRQAPPERKSVPAGVVWSRWTPEADAAVRTGQT